VRVKAAEENMSVARYVGKLLEKEMQRNPAQESDAELAERRRLAYEHWKTLGPIPGVDASKRWTREEVHDRKLIREYESER
jgi:hypothetical protein